MSELKRDIQQNIDKIESLKSVQDVSHLVFVTPPFVECEDGTTPLTSIVIAAALSKAQVNRGESRLKPITVSVGENIKGFGRHLSSKERDVLLNYNCLTLYRKHGRVFCAVPPYLPRSMKFATRAITPVPPDGCDWNLGVLRAMQDGAKKISEEKTNELRSDFNASVCYRTAKNQSPLVKQLLREMNRCHTTPYIDPEETIAISLHSYEMSVRRAEQCLKALLLLTKPKLRKSPFAEHEEQMRKWGHNLNAMWGELHKGLRQRIQSKIDIRDDLSLPEKVGTLMSRFTTSKFEYARYSWSFDIDVSSDFPQIIKPALKISFADLYPLFVVCEVLLEDIIPELTEENHSGWSIERGIEETDDHSAWAWLFEVPESNQIESELS